MRANLTRICRRYGAPICASLAALTITVAIMGGVGALFQSRGLPLERVVLAESACADELYVSQRESCMRQWLEATRSDRLASR